MKKNNINFAFFGTPNVASKTLELLKGHGLIPSIIVTAPDRPVGRKQTVTAPEVKNWAIKNNVPFLQPDKLNNEFKDKISAFNAKIFVVVAYGKIFPEWLINLPTSGTLNIHYSLLPKYRGAAPVQYAILNNEKETGVSIQKMIPELDAGPLIAQRSLVIISKEKTPELLEKLIIIGADLLSKTIYDYLDNQIKITAQIGDPSFAPKIKKEDGLINLDDNPMTNFAKFRAFYEWPRIYYIENNKRFIITDADLIDNKFIIKKIIPEGGSEIILS